jgi:sterol desaturase/sphingolipid hydroxylase (fatty acid hydroxylase superfamily)
MQISTRSILTFFNVNGTLLSISVSNYLVFYYIRNVTILYKLLFTYCVYIVRNYFMMFLLFNATKHKQFTTELSANNDSMYQIESHMYVLLTTFLDTITSICLYNNLTHFPISVSSMRTSMIWFIPMSLCFEIILDLFHYWTHRILHANKKWYVKTHKIHHHHSNPTIINAYYFSPYDIIFTISIPMMLTMHIIPFKLSLFEFTMISVYKQYTELAGHSGKQLAPASSFPQCIWLPRLLNIQLYAEDHDLHHKISNCNFAKRFSLWDKVFGTYYHKKNCIR